MSKKFKYIAGVLFAFVLFVGAISDSDESPRVIVPSPPAPVVAETTFSSEAVEVLPVQSEVVVEEVVPGVFGSESREEPRYYPVVGVVDGDTFKIDINGTVETLRLIGIDTPETVDPRKPVQCFGEEASGKAKSLLVGKRVRIEADPSQGERDKYGRLLVYAYLEDGTFFNGVMIEQGYAYEYTYDSAYAFQKEFRTAQENAKDNMLGLWSSDTCDGSREPQAVSPEGVGGPNFYTSSHPSAKYYYPVECSAWQSLSERYLKTFATAEELQSKYSRTLSPQCQE